MIGEIPEFEINPEIKFGNTLEGPIVDKNGFYRRVVDFIEFNLSTSQELDILCYLVDPESGTTMEAKLEEDGYAKSLAKSLEYYEYIEEYETCKTISNLIKKYELR